MINCVSLRRARDQDLYGAVRLVDRCLAEMTIDECVSLPIQEYQICESHDTVGTLWQRTDGFRVYVLRMEGSQICLASLCEELMGGLSCTEAMLMILGCCQSQNLSGFAAARESSVSRHFG